MTELENLPHDLPIPIDDGACDHLAGQKIPAIILTSTNGKAVSLKKLKGKVVIYCYPMTGKPDVKLLDGWDQIPGARGCTPQACSFRDNYHQIQNLDVKVFGISTQTTNYQRELKNRLHLPFDLLSDAKFLFANALKLPFHFVDNFVVMKRVTIIFKNCKVVKYFYPIFPSDKNVDDVIDWLKNN